MPVWSRSAVELTELVGTESRLSDPDSQIPWKFFSGWVEIRRNPHLNDPSGDHNVKGYTESAAQIS